jgi:hypothetical protein
VSVTSTPRSRAFHLQLDDLPELLARERREAHDVVEAVDELRFEVAQQRLAQPRVSRRGVPAGGAEVGGIQHCIVAHRNVGGHDQHRVLEVHRAALPVGEAAVVHHLQQRVEHVGVRLLDLVQQHHAVGVPAHRLRQLAALFVAHIPGRGADQA